MQTSSSFYQNYSPSQRSIFPPSSIGNERGAAAATVDDEASYRKPAAASRRNPRKIPQPIKKLRKSDGIDQRSAAEGSRQIEELIPTSVENVEMHHVELPPSDVARLKQ